jgi:hypothetical protein
VWKVFPYSYVFFDFSLQWFIVFIKNVFGFLCSIYSKVLYCFWVYCKGIVSLIFFLTLFMLVYRKPTDFYMLILYLTILLKEFIISNTVFVEFLWSLSIGSCQLQIVPVWLLPSLFETLFSCSFLIALARNLKTILNMSGESGHLVPALAGMVPVVLHFV